MTDSPARAAGRRNARHQRIGGRRRHRGFTLVEVLATLLLMAIVLPAIMQGISLATGAGNAARRRTEAAGLAESKLAELVSDGQWQGGILSGDFGPDWPDYRWDASVAGWTADDTNAGLQQLDVRVTWVARGRPDSVTVTTLVFSKTQQPS